MRIAVTGATGNLGIALTSALSADPAVDEVVGIARRRPFLELDKVRWVAADVVTDDLAPVVEGADVVVHLAWLIQPSRDPDVQWRVNVDGSQRVFAAAADAGVGAVVHASSVGTYSPGPDDEGAVDESWPTGGVSTSSYSRQKAYVERLLDTFEADHPAIRVVRMRPGLILQRAASTEIRRLFLGPFVPGAMIRRRYVPVVPRLAGLRFQVVHSADVAEAFRLAVLGDVRGAFNVATDPVLDPAELGRILGALPIPLPVRPTRALVGLLWKLRLQPTDPGWLDLLLSVPVMDTTRARTELGWSPTRAAADALTELLDGMRDGAGHGTPPLQGDEGPREIATGIRTGVGARDRRR